MEKPQITFVVYKANEGKFAELEAIVKTHYPTLKSLGLVTENKAFVGRASNNSLIEVFEWNSSEACFSAHGNPAVAQLWESMGAVSQIVTMKDLAESSKAFPHFERAF
jgi:hypothetical protein